MGELVFDVTYDVSRCVSLSVLGLTGLEAAALRRKHPECLITPRKLLPCAQRRWRDARIATLPSAGPSPVTGRGGDL